MKSKAGLLHAFWILLVSLFLTAQVCVRAIWKGWGQGHADRDFINADIQRWRQRMLKLLRIEYTLHNPHGVEPQPHEATLIMCNHSSLFDIPIGFSAFPRHAIRMLAKKELEQWPLMKYGMRAAEFPVIHRKNRTKAIENLKEVARLLKSGIVMWIFPEGTRSSDGQVLPFKKGGFITAIETKAKIIPIGIRGAHRVLAAQTLRPYLHQTVEIHIGQPIDARDYTLERKQELIDKVHEAIKALVGENL